MAKTYAQLAQEIETLKAKAEAVRKQEMAGVVTRIKQAIVAYELTAEDLGFGGTQGKTLAKAPRKSVTVKKGQSRPKYRDAAGNVWSGMGPRPKWLKAALAAGQPLSAFMTASDAPPPVGETAMPKTRKPRAQSSKKPKTVSVAKYKDDAGHSWSGRGPMPGWLKDAIAGGKTLEALAA